LKLVELTFLICYYRQVFKPIKKADIKLFCLIEYPDVFVGMYRDVSCYLKCSRYNFNDFSKQKFIETTRTDISNMLLSSKFLNLIKKADIKLFCLIEYPNVFRRDVSRCVLLSEVFHFLKHSFQLRFVFFEVVFF